MANESFPLAELPDPIVCPACHGKLAPAGIDSFRCAACRRSYPVVDGIPVLLLDRATFKSGTPG